jgi:hypothetical protein
MNFNTDIWFLNKFKDYEKIFNQLFSPEKLFGYEAIIYDEALKKSNYFGTTWKEELEKVDLYFSFVINYLESEGYSPDYFNEK